jgi:GntR family transcriptional regulator/MocR family aminotransferase
MGHQPLRVALASYLRASRGVQCEAEQIIITTSTQQSLMLAAQVLADPGDPVWIEDPCYHRAEASLASAGACLVSVPVDEEGLDLEQGKALGVLPRMVYITPSHQYPLGYTMSLRRRLALLDWARQHDVWIMEDDYVSEYRFEGKPLTALQGLDTAGRVLHMGTFSKVFTPAFRLGYLVIPEALVEPFRAVRSLVDRCPPFIDQAVLADFIDGGHLSWHIRKMRTIYAERRDVLTTAILDEAPDLLEVDPQDAGLHVLGWLPHGVDDREITRHLAENGIMAPSISYFFSRPPTRGALVLGYAGWNPPQLQESVRAMARTMRNVMRDR